MTDEAQKNLKSQMKYHISKAIK